MNAFVVVLLCIQACLIQNTFSQCQHSSYGSEVIYTTGNGAEVVIGGPAIIAPAPIPISNIYGYASNAGLGYNLGCTAGAGAVTFGGTGEGNVAVEGEIPVVGTTAVIGQVPILGAVSFEGEVPAFGAVSIHGRCLCGCGY